MIRTGNSQTSAFSKMLKTTINQTKETLTSLKDLNRMETLEDMFSDKQTTTKCKIVDGKVLMIGDFAFMISSVTKNGIYVETQEEEGYTTALVSWDKIS